MAGVREKLRAEFLRLESEKDEMEKEIEAIAAELNAPGPEGKPPVGLKGNLVDSQGFPRGDVDVHAIRIQRNRYAMLQTDHKKAMSRIEELLKEIMSLPKGEADNATGSVPQKADEDKGEEGEQSIQEENRNLLAFLWVERVEAGSPAEAAGLRVGDRILQFGNVRHVSGNVSPQFNAVVQQVGNSIDSPIEVLIERDLERIPLHLTPRRWDGRGMLGCNLMPVA